MLGKDTYEAWTKPFNAASRFEGDWSEGEQDGGTELTMEQDLG